MKRSEALFGTASLLAVLAGCSSSSAPTAPPDDAAEADGGNDSSTAPDATSGPDGADATADDTKPDVAGDAADAPPEATDGSPDGAPATHPDITALPSVSLHKLTVTVATTNGSTFTVAKHPTVTATGYGALALTVPFGYSGQFASETTYTPATHLNLPSGRIPVSVTAPGYVSWQGSIPIGDDESTVNWTVQLRPVDVTQAVPPTGGMVTVGAATLAFPSGAFAMTTNISAAWIDPNTTYKSGTVTHTTFEGASGSMAFGDVNVGTHVLLGALYVDTPTAPSSPTTVTVPAPAGATTADLALYPIDVSTGEWTDAPLRPTSVSGGVATFAVPHFSAWGLAQDAKNPCCIVSMSSPTGSLGPGHCYPSFGLALGPSDQICLQLPIRFGSESVCIQANGHTSYFRCEINSVSELGGAVYDAPSLNWFIDAEAPGLVKATSSVGVTTSLNVNRFLIRTRAAVIGVRGTSFDLTQRPCGAVGDLETLSVHEGEADIIYTPKEIAQVDASYSDPVTAGHLMTGCFDCDSYARKTCCLQPGAACGGPGCCAGLTCKNYFPPDGGSPALTCQ